jgi:hypothetical protein
MALTRYETSDVRRRLPGRTEQRGSQTGLPTWGMLLFGCPFIGVGAWAILAGTQTIPIDETNFNAPHWVLSVFGGVFALGGVMLWGMAARQFASNRRRLSATQGYQNEPALADFNWDPRGYEAPRWKRAFRTLLAAAFMTLFLSMFNWWAFFTKSPLMVKIIVGLFDLILLAVWWAAVVAIGRAVKFGGSRIEFAHFPYRVDESVLICWQPATGIKQVRSGSFTLRCVEEWFEQRGSGGDRSSHLVHEEIWSGKWHLEEDRAFELGQWMESRYNLPADALPTQLSAKRPLFWEFEVKLDLPGLDFEEVYLVPVYGTK